jgi:hypothetical protein
MSFKKLNFLNKNINFSGHVAFRENRHSKQYGYKLNKFKFFSIIVPWKSLHAAELKQLGFDA